MLCITVYMKTGWILINCMWNTSQLQERTQLCHSSCMWQLYAKARYENVTPKVELKFACSNTSWGIP